MWCTGSVRHLEISLFPSLWPLLQTSILSSLTAPSGLSLSLRKWWSSLEKPLDFCTQTLNVPDHLPSPPGPALHCPTTAATRWFTSTVHKVTLSPPPPSYTLAKPPAVSHLL